MNMGYCLNVWRKKNFFFVLPMEEAWSYEVLPKVAWMIYFVLEVAQSGVDDLFCNWWFCPRWCGEFILYFEVAQEAEVYIIVSQNGIYYFFFLRLWPKEAWGIFFYELLARWRFLMIIHTHTNLDMLFLVSISNWWGNLILRNLSCSIDSWNKEIIIGDIHW